MRRRVYVIVGEYSANPRFLPPERRSPEWLAEPAPEPPVEELSRLFFRYPNRSEDGRARPEDWEREFGLPSPVGLVDLLASSAPYRQVLAQTGATITPVSGASD